MQPQAPDAPILHLVATRAEPDPRPSRLDSNSADLALVDGGRLVARRDESVVHYALRAIPPDSDLLHPYLAAGAALTWQWRGHEALHAGVFATRAGAVLLLGAKESGKSMTLAWMARNREVPVITDDLAVIADGCVLPGPRCIDLRADATPGTGAAVRHDIRVRIALPEAPAPVPLAGLAVLAWGDAVYASPVAASERLAILGRQRTYPPLRGDDLALLELAALPMVTLARPRDASALAAACDTLLDRFA